LQRLVEECPRPIAFGEVRADRVLPTCLLIVVDWTPLSPGSSLQVR
jgi:hypothetical protein